MCQPAGELKTPEVCADYTRTPIHLGALLLALFWLHMAGDTSCVPHLCVFILLVILALFYAPAATQESYQEQS